MAQGCSVYHPKKLGLASKSNQRAIHIFNCVSERTFIFQWSHDFTLWFGLQPVEMSLRDLVPHQAIQSFSLSWRLLFTFSSLSSPSLSLGGPGSQGTSRPTFTFLILFFSYPFTRFCLREPGNWASNERRPLVKWERGRSWRDKCKSFSRWNLKNTDLLFPLTIILGGGAKGQSGVEDMLTVASAPREYSFHPWLPARGFWIAHWKKASTSLRLC